MPSGDTGPGLRMSGLAMESIHRFNFLLFFPRITEFSERTTFIIRSCELKE